MSGSPWRRRVRCEEDISGQFRVTVPDAEDLDQLRTRGGVYRRGLYPLGNRGNAPPEGTQSLPASSRESSTEPMDTDDTRRASAEIYRRIRQQAGLSRSGSVGDVTLQPAPLGIMTQGKLVLRRKTPKRSQAGQSNVEALFLKRVIKNVRSHDFYSPFYSFLASRYLFRVTIWVFFFGFYVFLIWIYYFL